MFVSILLLISGLKCDEKVDRKARCHYRCVWAGLGKLIGIVVETMVLNRQSAHIWYRLDNGTVVF